MIAQLDLPSTGIRTRAEFEALPVVPRGWAWELRSGRLELTHMPVTFWYYRIVFQVLELWKRLGYEIAGNQYVADSGFARGSLGRNNFLADGIVFRPGYLPLKYSTSHDAAHIHAVVDAVCQDSQVHDAIEKLRIYASLGVPHYWIIRGDTDSADLDGYISMYELAAGEYRLTGSRLVSELAVQPSA
ncbi:MULTISPECIES: Uma2 family endonuclease [unclassified Nocardia]|uniref:Uma2 family endonuclease n=1 Tax=unclassified Nocardia TaxID=2637762 RepID=UPI0024A85C01|nr:MULTISPECIES: Uma2 family endonuclease [unclassified Nocardia]